ncbi:MAG: hypothetical protein PHX45_00015 [Acidobacteriota bacterium]|nr:hypothetical protein [Acidobacteriota bacterium]
MNKPFPADISAGFKKVDITPPYPVSLAGYFNRRISERVLDPLHMRLAVLERDGRHLAFIQLDNCAIRTEDVDEIKNRIADRGRFRPREIMIWASHIHNGPDLEGFFGMPPETGYLDDLKNRIVEEAGALEPVVRCSVQVARAAYQGLAFNRRWFLKDGRVVTNPPKMSPEMDRPEGPVDREANFVVFVDENGRRLAVFVNISNHTDTVGGNDITADWPGFLEKGLNSRIGADIPVFPLIGPQGNINHYEFDSPRGQIGYEEAARLGAAYAEIVASSLKNAAPAAVGGMDAVETILSIPSMDIPPEEISAAEAFLARLGMEESPPPGKSLTAEDLMKGDPVVERIFAKGLLDFAKNKPARFAVPLQVFKLGPIALAAIPGEPFVEVGLALKAVPGYDLVVPVALANGYFGYIPLEENFRRGGYEIRAGVSSILSKDAARRIVDGFRRLLG